MLCSLTYQTSTIKQNCSCCCCIVCLLLFMCCLLPGLWCLLHYSSLLDASLFLLLCCSCLTEKCQFGPVNKSPQQEKGLFLHTLSLHLLQTHLPYSNSFITLVWVISLSDPRIIFRLLRIYYSTFQLEREPLRLFYINSSGILCSRCWLRTQLCDTEHNQIAYISLFSRYLQVCTDCFA